MNSEKKRGLSRWLCLLGTVSLISYTAAVVFSPLAYPDYDWLSQAVSDLSAMSAPSLSLWNRLSALYMPCGIVCCTVCCIDAAGRYNKCLRTGVYLFAAMNWLSAVGYAMFPLTEAGAPSDFQGIMHMVVTAGVVLLSVGSLTLIGIGGLRGGTAAGLGRWAVFFLCMMLLGAVGTGVVPSEYFGIPERMSVFAATGFNAVLGIYFFKG